MACRFGDKDGVGGDALLQHPLAVLAAPDGKGETQHICKLPAGGPWCHCCRGGHAAYLFATATCPGTPFAAVCYVADSYNNKIKVIDIAAGRIRTLAGTGSAGFLDGVGGAAQLSEPGGLALGPSGGWGLSSNMPTAYSLMDFQLVHVDAGQQPGSLKLSAAHFWIVLILPRPPPTRTPPPPPPPPPRHAACHRRLGGRGRHQQLSFAPVVDKDGRA